MNVVFALIALVLVTGVIVVLLKPPGQVDAIEPSPNPPNTATMLPSPFTADDLQRVSLPLAVRGYRMADVDALLERIANEWRPAGVDSPPPGQAHAPADQGVGLPSEQPRGKPILPVEQPTGPPMEPHAGRSAEVPPSQSTPYPHPQQSPTMERRPES